MPESLNLHLPGPMKLSFLNHYLLNFYMQNANIDCLLTNIQSHFNNCKFKLTLIVMIDGPIFQCEVEWTAARVEVQQTLAGSYLNRHFLSSWLMTSR
jgi:hypothetical protein